MNIKKNSSICLLLMILVMITVFNHPVNAIDNRVNSSKSSLVRLSEFEIRKQHEEQIQNYLNSLSLLYPSSFGNKNTILPFSENPDDYKYERLTPIEKTVSGYPLGQPRDGFHFKNGGEFIYSPNGGGNASASISIPGFKVLTISVPIGTVGDNGSASYGIPVPKRDGYYKLKIFKKVSVEPIKIYKRHFNEQTWSYEWSLFGITSSTVIVDIDYDIERKE